VLGGLGGLRGLLVFPFAHYGAFFAFACGALPYLVVVSFYVDSFSRGLFCHLNHFTFNSVCKEKPSVVKITIGNNWIRFS
jgi:hypothetical protein